MIDIDEYFGTFDHYINVDILESNPELANATISDLNFRTFDGEKKVAISFRENNKELILNQTNRRILSATFGENPTTWLNKKISLQVVDVNFNGATRGIRISIPIPEPPRQQENPVINPVIQKDLKEAEKEHKESLKTTKDILTNINTPPKTIEPPKTAESKPPIIEQPKTETIPKTPQAKPKFYYEVRDDIENYLRVNPKYGFKDLVGDVRKDLYHCILASAGISTEEEEILVPIEEAIDYVIKEGIDN